MIGTEDILPISEPPPSNENLPESYIELVTQFGLENFPTSLKNSVRRRDMNRDQFSFDFDQFLELLPGNLQLSFCDKEEIIVAWSILQELRYARDFNDIHHIVSRKRSSEISELTNQKFSPNLIQNLILINRGVHEFLHIDRNKLITIIYDRLAPTSMPLSEFAVMCMSKHSLYGFLDSIQNVIFTVATIRTVHFSRFKIHPKIKTNKLDPSTQSRILSNLEEYFANSSLVFPGLILNEDAINLNLAIYSVLWQEPATKKIMLKLDHLVHNEAEQVYQKEYLKLQQLFNRFIQQGQIEILDIERLPVQTSSARIVA